jgi:hypothetical protein
MPYYPGIQDVSGQLRAQGIRGASSTITQGFEEFGKRERERQSALGSIMGSIQGDPSFMDEVSKNPDSDLAKIFSRAQSGRASNAEIQQLGGALSSRRFDQERQAKEAAAESERTRNAALNTMAIAQAAQIKGAEEERLKNRDQATARAKVFANVLNNRGRDADGNAMPFDPTAFIKAIGEEGLPLDAQTMGLFDSMQSSNLGQSKLAQTAAASAEKARIAQAELDKSRDKDLDLINAMVKSGDYTPEEGKQQRRKLVDYRSTRPLSAGAEFAAALGAGAGAGAGAGTGGMDPRVRDIIPGGAKPPAPRGGRMITVQNPSTGATFQVDESRAQEILAKGGIIL